jgi:hypothetical protein
MDTIEKIRKFTSNGYKLRFSNDRINDIISLSKDGDLINVVLLDEFDKLYKCWENSLK